MYIIANKMNKCKSSWQIHICHKNNKMYNDFMLWSKKIKNNLFL